MSPSSVLQNVPFVSVAFLSVHLLKFGSVLVSTAEYSASVVATMEHCSLLQTQQVYHLTDRFCERVIRM